MLKYTPGKVECYNASGSRGTARGSHAQNKKSNKDEKTTVNNRELKSMVEFYKKDMVPKYDIPEL